MVIAVKMLFRFCPESKYSVRALCGSLEDIIEEPSDIGLLRDIEEIDDSQKGRGFCLCFSVISFFAKKFYGEVARLRQRVPQALFIAGGPHASVKTKECLENGFDFVARGEGEEIIREIYRALKTGSNIGDIKGVYHLENGELKGLPNTSQIVLDNYKPYSKTLSLYGPVEIVRGCAHACRFCQASYLFGAKERCRSEEKVLEHMELLRAAGYRYFRFIAPNALSYRNPDNKSLENIESLFKGVRAIIGPTKKLVFGTFPSEVRPEFITKESAELIKKYCDNSYLVFGTQSGSARMLDAMHRGHDEKAAVEAVDILKKAGLGSIVDFLFGLPGETAEDLADSLKMLEVLVSKGARINAHVFMPLPGTPWEKEAAGKVDAKVAAILKEKSISGCLRGDWEQQFTFNAGSD